MTVCSYHYCYMYVTAGVISADWPLQYLLLLYVCYCWCDQCRLAVAVSVSADEVLSSYHIDHSDVCFRGNILTTNIFIDLGYFV